MIEVLFFGYHLKLNEMVFDINFQMKQTFY
jgi:hypothetical protein